MCNLSTLAEKLVKNKERFRPKLSKFPQWKNSISLLPRVVQTQITGAGHLLNFRQRLSERNNDHKMMLLKKTIGDFYK